MKMTRLAWALALTVIFLISLKTSRSYWEKRYQETAGPEQSARQPKAASMGGTALPPVEKVTNGHGVARRREPLDLVPLEPCQLGLMYEFGQGVPRNYAVAAKWFLISARRGDSLAQFSIGQMYVEGEGVTQDFVEAYKWLNIAATSAQGFELPPWFVRDSPNATNAGAKPWEDFAHGVGAVKGPEPVAAGREGGKGYPEPPPGFVLAVCRT